MKALWKNMHVESIVSLKREERANLLGTLSNDKAAVLLGCWRHWARKEQLPPGGCWNTWLYLGGRGTGKTRAGAEWVADGVQHGKLRHVALIGATHNDARAVMVEGVSGLMAVAKGATYEPSNHRVRWENGAVATVLSAEEPDAIRGHQFDGAWGDEFAKWRDPQGALDMLRMALRIGKKPRLLLTTTPRNIAALKTLMEEKGVVHTHSRTSDNVTNLAPGFVESLEARYGGTRLGRQELDAEIIADNDAAMWQRDWIERGRVREAPEMTRVVVAVDPPASTHGDECGIVAVGRSVDNEAYVLADRSMGGLTPLGWSSRVAETYETLEADAIVAEANQGGEMVRTLLNGALPNARVRLAHARRAKQIRAEPAVMLYEQGRVHHVGVFPELEDQMCNYDGTGDSPDRLDALVWALRELFPGKKAGEPKIHGL